MTNLSNSSQEPITQLLTLRERHVRLRTSVMILTHLSTEDEITTVFAAGTEDIEIAIEAAEEAINDSTWRELPGTS